MSYKPFHFLIITIIISWSFWIPAAISGIDAFSFPIIILLFFGGLGPMFASIILTYRTLGMDGIKNLWKRLSNFKEINKSDYLIIFILIPVICLVAMLFEGITLGTFKNFNISLKTLSTPLSLISLILFTFFFGPLPEEIGWRGYGLDSLQDNFNPTKSTLIVGTVWSLWHLPLFFMKGTYQNELGLWTSGFWLFFIGPVVISFLITYIYNNTNRSTLSAVLLHFMNNFSGQFFEPSEIVELIRSLSFGLIAIIVVIYWNKNPQTFYKKEEKDLKES